MKEFNAHGIVIREDGESINGSHKFRVITTIPKHDALIGEVSAIDGVVGMWKNSKEFYSLYINPNDEVREVLKHVFNTIFAYKSIKLKCDSDWISERFIDDIEDIMVEGPTPALKQEDVDQYKGMVDRQKMKSEAVVAERKKYPLLSVEFLDVVPGAHRQAVKTLDAIQHGTEAEKDKEIGKLLFQNLQRATDEVADELDKVKDDLERGVMFAQDSPAHRKFTLCVDRLRSMVRGEDG